MRYHEESVRGGDGMQYQSQTGGVEITLSELCALAFGRSNYTEEAEAAHDAGSLSANAGSY